MSSSIIKAALAIPKSTENKFDVAEKLLLPLKSQCKKGDPAVIRELFYYLKQDLLRPSGTVRMRCLFVINYLFMRSKIFRDSVSENMKLIARCAGLLKSLPIATINGETAKDYKLEVETRVKEYLEIWDAAFGHFYPQLRAMLRYLRESLQLQMPNILLSAQRFAEDERQRAITAKNMVLLRKNKILAEELPRELPPIKESLRRIEECFLLIFNAYDEEDNTFSNNNNNRTEECSLNDDKDGNDDEDEIEWEDENIAAEAVGLSSYQGLQHEDSSANFDSAGADTYAPESGGASFHTLELTLSTSIQDIENADNAVVVEILRELSKHMSTYSRPKLIEWRRVLSRAAALYSKQLDEAMQMQQPTVNPEDHYQKQAPFDSFSAQLISPSIHRPISNSVAISSEASQLSRKRPIDNVVDAEIPYKEKRNYSTGNITVDNSLTENTTGPMQAIATQRDRTVTALETVTQVLAKTEKLLNKATEFLTS